MWTRVGRILIDYGMEQDRAKTRRQLNMCAVNMRNEITRQQIDAIRVIKKRL